MLKQLKTLLTSAAILAASSSFCCWFTEDNFNSCYIARVNNNAIHYKESPSESLTSAKYYNNISVDQPMTVYVKVSPRYEDQPGYEQHRNKPIVRAELQYKVGNKGKWVTVRKIENVKWSMNWNHPVALFGRNNIYIPNLKAGTEITIRVQFSDGVFVSGQTDSEVINENSGKTIKTEETSTTGIYDNGWTAPFVFKVKYSGKERPW